MPDLCKIVHKEAGKIISPMTNTIIMNVDESSQQNVIKNNFIRKQIYTLLIGYNVTMHVLIRSMRSKTDRVWPIFGQLANRLPIGL